MSYLDNNFYKGADSTEGISFTNPYGNNYKWYHYFFAFLLFVFAYWGITTNSDWGTYEFWFSNDSTDVDIAYGFLCDWFKSHGLHFRALYRFHILLMGLFYTILFKKLKVNPIGFTLLLLLFCYVPMGNQIRYYVGFPMTLLALINFSDRRYTLAAILAVLAFFFHSSLLLFFTLYLGYFYIVSRINSWKIPAIIVANGLAYFFIYYRMTLEHFDSYIIEDSFSSLMGGIYNLFVTIVYTYCTFLVNRDIVKGYPDIAQSKEYKMFYNCIMMGTMLFLCSITTQIFVHRMMGMALLPIWLTFFIRAKRLNNKVISRRIVASLIVIFLFYSMNLLGVFTGSNAYVDQIELMLNSYTLH